MYIFITQTKITTMTEYSAEIDQLVALGSKAYALKHYESATETLGQACEKYTDQTGKEDPDLLFLYGRSLFQAGVQSSAVLGGGSEQPEEKKEEEEAPAKSSGAFQFEEAPEEGAEEDEEEAETKDKGKGPADEEDEEEGGEEEGEAEDQSDFEVAWEVTDLARKLFEDKLEGETEKSAKEAIEKKLAEVYDILGEIALESENFPQAALDLGKSVELKEKFNDFHSTIMSEAHYKYSLALEFCVEDESAKKKAVDQMTLALDSVKKRIAMTGEKDNDLVNDLEIRLNDLKAAAKGATELDATKADIISGILGNSSDDIKSMIASAMGGAEAKPVNDLSGLARKKAPKRVAPETTQPEAKKQKEDVEEKTE